ncbi:MAG: Rne/Rng family ribonuclease [Candidatus Latescibacteria bacterium]|nr:Rne/Rng family ribonuclease [Candidatus Latescibacterota bacterium]
MRKEIIINVASHETRIAILEDGELVEILVERSENERTVGDIYKGVVTAVLPGMQAAFVDIGLEKSAFLHVSDVADTDLVDSTILDDQDGEEEEETPVRSRRPSRFVPIQNLLQKGQEIMVQITKEQIGTKGPRVTSQVSLPGRFVVLVPGESYIGVSRKITNWAEKRRLRDLVRSLKLENIGIIIRTVGEGHGQKELEDDINRLVKLWQKIERKAKRLKAPCLLHEEMGMTSSLIRDLFSEDVDRVVTDSKYEYKQILSYLKTVAPNLRSRVELYREQTPIFDAFNIESEIEKTLDRKVWLKKGGFLVIDHTEAMVTIDVNSGKYVGTSDHESTMLKINLDAAREIARQLRLRDIGGIIVIDFIDMTASKNRKRIADELIANLKRDRSKISVSQMSDFGLVEMTRQRVRPSLLYTFSEPCPTCSGIGRVQGRDTTLTKIERWLKRATTVINERRLTLYVHPTVAEYLGEDDGERLKAIRRATRVRLDVTADPNLSIEDYRFFSLERNMDITEEFRT